MRREFIFVHNGEEIILPVTPQSYQLEVGTNIEIVNIHEKGDVSLPGHGTLATVRIDCLLPYRNYRFASDSDPDFYIEAFTRFARERAEVRWVVSDTGVNLPVWVQSFQYGERDGTNDVYASITLRERRKLDIVTTVTGPAQNVPRAQAPEASGEDPYTVKPGDTLCSICRKYYGNDSPDTYYRLASYNGMDNPNILMAGWTLRIPLSLSDLRAKTQPYGGKTPDPAAPVKKKIICGMGGGPNTLKTAVK